MKATIQNPAHLKEALKIIISLATDVRLVFGENKLRIDTLDVAQAAHVVYEHRSCDAPDEFTADIVLDHLIQALKNASKDQEVTISLQEDEIMVVEYNKPRYTKYTIPLL